MLTWQFLVFSFMKYLGVRVYVCVCVCVCVCVHRLGEGVERGLTEI